MSRPYSTTPTLIPTELAAACSRLADRVHAWFPNRGIDRHAQWLAAHVAQVVADGRSAIEAPRWLRLISDIGGVAALVLLLATSFLCVRRVGDIDYLPTYLSSLDAFLTVLAATVAGGLTMRSVRQRVERDRAIRKLNTLRSFAHVTDMLQVSKCPTRLLFVSASELPVAGDDADAPGMSRYIACCAEIMSMTGTVAALYGEWTSDALAHSAIDDVEQLCATLEGKSLQRVLLLEQMNQRIRQPGA